LVLNDSTSRHGPNNINGNNIYSGNLTITTNSIEVTAETLISNTDPNQVSGNVTFNINAPVLFSVGEINSNNYLNIFNDLNLNSNVAPQYIILDGILFLGATESHIRQLGTTPVTIQNLYTGKAAAQAY